MNKHKILLLGSTGQLGRTILNNLDSQFETIIQGRKELTFSDKNNLIKSIADINPDILINACAYTDVDGAEGNSKEAFEVNSELPLIIAETCKDLNCLLVHYSTDYVFDGEKTLPYTEEDDCNPINTYGESKRQGEKAVMESGCKYLLFRTSWVFSPYRKNFVLTILRLASERNQLKVIDDQLGCPTSCSLISRVTNEFIHKYINRKGIDFGLFHLASSGETNWYEFSKEIIKLANAKDSKIDFSEDQILPIKTEEYPSPAARPRNSVIDTSKLNNQLDVKLVTWQSCLKSTINEIYS